MKWTYICCKLSIKLRMWRISESCTWTQLSMSSLSTVGKSMNKILLSMRLTNHTWDSFMLTKWGLKSYARSISSVCKVIEFPKIRLTWSIPVTPSPLTLFTTEEEVKLKMLSALLLIALSLAKNSFRLTYHVSRAISLPGSAYLLPQWAWLTHRSAISLTKLDKTNRLESFQSRNTTRQSKNIALAPCFSWSFLRLYSASLNIQETEFWSKN